MNSDELLDAFRFDVVDTAKPYLWSDDEAYRYMADAHRMFVRLIGGLADITTDAVCLLDCPIGQAEVELHPSILRILQARRVSDNAPVQIINQTDAPRLLTSDYGRQIDLFMSTTQGPVRYMMIGQKRNYARLYQVPVSNEQLRLSVMRLPLDVADGPGKELTDVAEEHHYHLLAWMRRCAYLKQDAETFDKSKSSEAEQEFRAYCAQVRAEWDRYKHKTRCTQYGGL